MNHRQMKSNPRSLQWLLAVMFCIAPLTAAQAYVGPGAGLSLLGLTIPWYFNLQFMQGGEGVVSGLITAQPQGALSEVSTRAARRGTPLRVPAAAWQGLSAARRGPPP